MTPIRILFIASLSFFFAGSLPEANASYSSAMAGSRPAQQEGSYYQPLSAQEKNEIAFIITTLATKPALSLLFEKKSLQRAGARVSHVHPLRFLQYAFTDQVLAGNTKKIKGIAWRKFVEDMAKGLASTYQQGMISKEVIEDFAKETQVPIQTLLPLYNQRKWAELINHARNNLPR